MTVVELNKEQLEYYLNEQNLVDSIDIVLSKDNCPFCDKLKNNIHAVDTRTAILFVNLDNPEFVDYKKSLMSSKLVSFVPTLLQYRRVNDQLIPKVVVDDELYEVLFDGRIKR